MHFFRYLVSIDNQNQYRNEIKKQTTNLYNYYYYCISIKQYRTLTIELLKLKREQYLC